MADKQSDFSESGLEGFSYEGINSEVIMIGLRSIEMVTTMKFHQSIGI